MNFKPGDESVRVNGVNLECRWAGPGPDQAPTIVLLHEGLGSAGQWRDFPDRLAAATGCGVFAFSRQGYGRSDPVALPRPVSFMHDEGLVVLPALFDAIGFQRGILLGHSDGASIATIYAGGVQDHRVRGLVLYAPHFFVEDVSVKSIAAARQAFEAGDLRTRLEKYHGANTDCAFRGWSDVWLEPAFRQWDITESVAYIRVPILIVQGVDDEYGTAAQLRAAEGEAYCPVECVLLANCGHAPHVDQATETMRLTKQFAERLLVGHGEAAGFAVTGDCVPPPAA